MNEIEDLIWLSKEIGANKAYVQGGGGNISVKLDDKYMQIKSSGICLKNIDKKNGYTTVDYNYIKKVIPLSTESCFDEKILFSSVDNKVKPSIETGFHSILGKYVIHTHSVYVNILTCSKEGSVILKNLFPDSLWIDYYTPGRSLTIAINEKIKNNLSKIIFLQNHGVIVSENNANEVFKKHDYLNNKIRNYLNLNLIKYRKINKPIKFENYLFPDQIVYEYNTKSRAIQEIFWAYCIILKLMKEKRLTPNFLLKENVDIIKSMKSEKYRQKVVI